MVMMITSTFTFSQHIGGVYIGLSPDSTIELCESLGYEFIEQDNVKLKFIAPNNNLMYDFDVELNMYFSPESKTVWFGTITYTNDNKREVKKEFLNMFKTLKQTLGKPYKVRRKEIDWDNGHAIISIERGDGYFKYTVISTGAFNKVLNEYAYE